MTLLWIEGFDGRTHDLNQAYGPGTIATGTLIQGRFGAQYAWRGGPVGTDQTTVFMRPLDSAKDGIVMGAAVANGASYGADSSAIEAGLFEFWSGGACVLSVRVAGTNHTTAPPGQVRVVQGDWNVAGSPLGTTTKAFLGTNWEHIEVKVIPGASGSVVVRQNGLETLNLSGVDTGSASIDKVALRISNSGSPTYAGNSWLASVDDWWVCDTTASTLNNDFLGDLRVFNVVPSGPSVPPVTQLMPSTAPNWDCVNEVPPLPGADYVGHSVIGYKDLYVHAALPTAYTNIRGARMVSLAQSSDAGVIGGRNICLSGATTFEGPDRALSPTAQIFFDLLELDPGTSAQWTNATFNAAQFGWEVRA